MNRLSPEFARKFDSPEIKAELAKGFYRELEAAITTAGGEFNQNMNDLYHSMSGKELLIRREDPQRVMEMLQEDDQALTIQLDPSIAPYPNALKWQSQYGDHGLRIAMAEGFGQHLGITTILGFEKGEQLTVQHVENLQAELSTPDRELIRSIEGTIHTDDLAFIAIRIPVQRFDERLMTEDEQERYEEWLDDDSNAKQPMFIFRGASFIQKVREEKLAA